MVGVDEGVERASITRDARAGAERRLRCCGCRFAFAPLHISLDLLEIIRGHRGSDILREISVIRPGILVVVKRRFDGCKLSCFRRGVGPARRLVTIFVHLQREVVVDQIDLPRGDIVIDERPERLLEEGPARGALVIGEHFEPDGRAARSVSLIWRAQSLRYCRTGRLGGRPQSVLRNLARVQRGRDHRERSATYGAGHGREDHNAALLSWRRKAGIHSMFLRMPLSVQSALIVAWIAPHQAKCVRESCIPAPRTTRANNTN